MIAWCATYSGSGLVRDTPLASAVRYALRNVNTTGSVDRSTRRKLNTEYRQTIGKTNIQDTDIRRFTAVHALLE